MGGLEEIRKMTREIYDSAQSLIRKFMDMSEENYNIASIWVAGTYFHKAFESFPYLFINATKSSGKTRLLKLIAHLSNKGQMITSLRESSLFRTAGKKTFCIDEFESIARKEKQELRELLNGGYKKGLFVPRERKIKDQFGERYVTEYFELYSPITIANIWGMEDVLQDRCITLYLEKSNDPSKTRLLEIFGKKPNFSVGSEGSVGSVGTDFSVGSVVSDAINNIYNGWNYLHSNYLNPTQHTLHTLHTLSYTYTTDTTSTNILQILKGLSDTPDLELLEEITDFFPIVLNSTLSGRHLELFFPLFITAYFVGTEELEKLIQIAEIIISAKQKEEVVESRDVTFLDFISKKDYSGFVSIRIITNEFKEFMDAEDEEIKWISSEWIGRCLKRLGLIIDKRRVNTGREIIINIPKAKEKIRIFKPEEPPSSPDPSSPQNSQLTFKEALPHEEKGELKIADIGKL